MKRRYGFEYHLTVPKGLINDPNGLVQFRGQYHVFYQWNQETPTHANKSWGHVVSDDMVTWKELPVALEPVDWYDKNGVYSGSAIVHEDMLYLFYTGNVKDENDVRSTYQCLATSQDGVTFTKHGPLFEYPEGYTAHTRDPKVWFDENENQWLMVLGAQREDLTGDTILYRSKNLKNWEFVGSILQFDKPLGYMWECPDIIKFPETDVFIFSPQGVEPKGDCFHNIYQTAYVTGKFNGEIFELETSEMIEQDRGFEWYAPQTFYAEDGRVIQYGWMGITQPDKEQAIPTVTDGWVHHLSVPRELSIKNGKLNQCPVVEIEQYRREEQVVAVSETAEIDLKSSASDVLIQLSDDESFSFVLRDEVIVSYDRESRKVSVERTDWLTQEREKRRATLPNGVLSLRLLIEDSSLEMFINGGEEVFSLRYFTEEKDNVLKCAFNGSVTHYTMGDNGL